MKAQIPVGSNLRYIILNMKPLLVMLLWPMMTECHTNCATRPHSALHCTVSAAKAFAAVFRGEHWRQQSVAEMPFCLNTINNLFLKHFLYLYTWGTKTEGKLVIFFSFLSYSIFPFLIRWYQKQNLNGQRICYFLLIYLYIYLNTLQ